MEPFFDWGVPGDWTDIYEEIFLPAYINTWPERLIDRVALRAGERALDVACGTGAWARRAAERVGPSGQIVGIDLNPDMLAVARRKSGADAVTAAIEWHEGSVEAMPFDDERFDVVCCQLGMMFFPDCVAALREMQRVLADEGRFVTMVWGRMENCPGQAAVAAAWTRHLGPDAADGFHRQHLFADPAAIRSMIEAAGFRQVESGYEVGEARLPSPSHLVRSYAALIGLEVSPQTGKALIDDVDQALAPYVGPEGLVFPMEVVIGQGQR